MIPLTKRNNWNVPRRSLFIVCLLAGLLSGCMIGPNFKRPETAMAKQWMAAGQKQIVGKPVDPVAWWRVFNDPMLDSLVTQAQNQNLALQAAALRIVQARTLKSGAVWTEFPAITGPNASYTDTHYSRNVEPPGEIKKGSIKVLADGRSVPQPNKDLITFPRVAPGVPQIAVTTPEIVFKKEVQVYRAGFDALWELDVWGQKRRLIEAASASYQGSIADYDGALISLAAEVAATYIEIRTLEERLRATRENVTILEHFLSAAEERTHSAQATDDLDVQMARTLLTDVQASIPTLESSQRVAENSLCVLLAKPPQDLHQELNSPRPIPGAPTAVAVGIPADLLRRRPDVRLAEFEAWSQCARIGVAKGSLFPSFSLLGSLGLASSNTGKFFSAKSFYSTYGGAINWNPFLYPFIIENVRLQDAKYQEAIAEYKNSVLRAAAEVESSSARFLGVQDELKALTESAEASCRAANLALSHYQQGTLQYPGTVEALQYRVQQQDRVIQARGEVSLTLVALYKALGGGWQLSRDKPLLPEDTRKQMRQRTDWRSFTGKREITPKEFKQPEVQNR